LNWWSLYNDSNMENDNWELDCGTTNNSCKAWINKIKPTTSNDNSYWFIINTTIVTPTKKKTISFHLTISWSNIYFFRWIFTQWWQKGLENIGIKKYINSKKLPKKWKKLPIFWDHRLEKKTLVQSFLNWKSQY
jgi:hypothetical protein